MASQGPQAPRRSESELDLQTLVLTALASATAAYITSKLWAPGTLFSAAMTPVVVALIKEALRKPAEVMTAVVPRRPRTGETIDFESTPGDMAEQYAAGAPPVHPPPEPGAEAGRVRVYSTRRRRLRWRLAVVTGLLGFVICVIVYTVPEVVAGGSLARPGHETTLWGGTTHRSGQSTTSTTTTSTTQTSTTQTTPTTTTGQTTPTVTQTVTVPPPSAATPPTTTTPTTPAGPEIVPPATPTTTAPAPTP
jgi:hypothetical protein